MCLFRFTRSYRVNSVQTSSAKLSHPLTYLGTLNATDSEKHTLGGRVYCRSVIYCKCLSRYSLCFLHRQDDENVLSVSNFLYTKPGPDAFFWAGETGGCDDGSIDNRSKQK